jgi:hypothetical protein
MVAKLDDIIPEAVEIAQLFTDLLREMVRSVSFTAWRHLNSSMVFRTPGVRHNISAS